ncbi:hypothetical protein LCGC14_1060910 [marine sediment metagenome]|uniref:Uncharacterized protein n=1 Tax=marine sediment metagenome TaxID=412755 RepID=A0A0F9ML74_9ZZZZ
MVEKKRYEKSRVHLLIDELESGGFTLSELDDLYNAVVMETEKLENEERAK